ncbi:hypothetical protein TD95_004913 [Thielaviopsis punctulata]|uniref:Uncharacterized protein n=1 Tax=Thielaviopsis punctulata TaxID=72032 RepID=A0A0F4ZGX3_9PEZI|nr:hypothetical protein TD95_004913 [Thielaviopsis punctulata]
MSPANPDLKKRTRADYPFFLDYRTRWADNDMYKHMNNAIYVFLFDSVLSAYLHDHCGLIADSSPQHGMIVHSHTDYFAQISFPAVADLGLRVNKIGRTSVTHEIGLFERGFDDIRAVGEFVQVWVDRDTRRPAVGGINRMVRAGLDKIFMGSTTGSKL